MDFNLRKIVEILPQKVQISLKDACDGITEIRLRKGLASTVTTSMGNMFLSSNGPPTPICTKPVTLTEEEMGALYLVLCKNSVYARQEELSGGYVTYDGFRAGISGETVMQNGEVVGFKNITAINIRIAREIKGVAKNLADRVSEHGQVLSTLIVAPPSGGKTTILRDLARILSVRRHRVTIVDERKEIAGTNFDVGPMTEVLSGLPKAKGCEMALRTLSPEVIIMDEVGSMEEVEALLQTVGAGVSFIASCHARSPAELARRPQFKRLYQAGVLELVVMLKGREVGEIFDLRETYNEADRNNNANNVVHGGRNT